MAVRFALLFRTAQSPEAAVTRTNRQVAIGVFMLNFFSRGNSFNKLLLAAGFLSSLAGPVFAQTSPQTPDMPAKFESPVSWYDYEKRNVMIPMRDGIKLFTVIVV